MKLRKIIYSIAVALLVAAIGIGWWVGSYFVDFAFKRGTDKDPKALPHASVAIISPNSLPHPKPNFKAEAWELQLNGEKRVATAFYTDSPSNKWVIMVHGYCRDQRFTWNYASRYLQNGYNVLTPDLNASGESEGVYLTMGIKESDDIVAWSEKLAKKETDAKIVLHGISMGAATVLMAAQKTLPSQVYAVIEDCGYTSAYEMFGVKLKEMFGLPKFPVLNLVDMVSQIKNGILVSDAAPIKNMKKCKLPVLFIHGDEDGLTPLAMVDELYNACTVNIKEKYIAKGATHASSMSVNPELYFAKVLSFLQRVE